MFRLLFYALPALVFYGTSHSFLFWLSVSVGILGFWSFGVMHNFAMASAKSRYDRLAVNMFAEGRSAEDVARLDALIVRPNNADIEAVPSWITLVDMAAAAAALVLLVWGILVYAKM